MLIMGTNSWEGYIPERPLIRKALEFAEDVKSQGIAELQFASIAHEQRLMWCTWETDNLKALEAAFAEMNKRGLHQGISRESWQSEYDRPDLAEYLRDRRRE